MFLVFQEFRSYSDENDNERVQQIIKKAVEDANWVVQKVCAWKRELGFEKLRVEHDTTLN